MKRGAAKEVKPTSQMNDEDYANESYHKLMALGKASVQNQPMYGGMTITTTSGTAGTHTYNYAALSNTGGHA